jgi:hypothetical protein
MFVRTSTGVIRPTCSRVFDVFCVHCVCECVCVCVQQPMDQHRASRVSDRETDYQKRRVRTLSPERVDPFAAQTPDSSSRTFRVRPACFNLCPSR